MNISDALSRQSSHNTKNGNNTEVKGYDISIHALEADVTDCKLEKICIVMQCDAELQMLIKHIIEGWPDTCDQCPDPIHDYFTFRHKLSVIDRLVLKVSNCIVFSFRFNKNNTQSKNFSLLARSECRYQGINFNCQECAKHSSQQCPETLCNDLVTTQPWIALACDPFEYQGKIYLIVIDHYSKLIAVEPVADHSAKKTVNAFLQVFSKLGIPTTFVVTVVQTSHVRYLLHFVLI